jgi:hypothetical protein
MARPRLPQARAIATGRVLHDPKRFADRKEPDSTGPLGPPPARMKLKDQRESWETFRLEIPWLQKSHRALVGIAAVDLNVGDGGHFLSTRLNVRLPGLERNVAKELVNEAEKICPYSKATRGNVGVTINLI